MQVKINLIVVDDDLIRWLKLIGFWDETVRFNVERIGGLLPLDLEAGVTSHLATKGFDQDCASLMKKILKNFQSGKGLSIKNLGLEKSDFDQILEEGDCACAVLERFDLISIKKTREDVFLKPSRSILDTRIAKLAGVNV